MATFNLKVITPDRVFYEGEVEKIVIRGSEGDMAILPNHMPLNTILSMGEIKIFTDKKNHNNATLINGFAKIEPSHVVILTDAAEWPEEIDVERALSSKERAEKRREESHRDQARVKAALRRAIVRIEVAKTLQNK